MKEALRRMSLYTGRISFSIITNMTAMNLNPVLEQVIEETAASEERTLDLNTHGFFLIQIMT